MDALTRRGFLAGSAATLALVGRGRAEAAGTLAGLLESSGLAGMTSLVVADAASGAVIEAWAPEVAMPPASVAKVPTALFALDVLGGGFRFRTRVLATGPVEDGVLAGHLVLAGGGDPVLDTDRMGDLVAAVRARGIARVAGRFLVAEGALPRLDEIEAGQPRHAGYNPALSGMNLNFNRVQVDWAQVGGAPRLGVQAPGERFRAGVAGVGAGVGQGWRHETPGGGLRERWLLPRGMVAGRGSVWLPVRRPAAYAGEVFRALAGEAGLGLPAPEVVAGVPAGQVIAVSESPALARMMADMLRYSTNLTAEVAGLTAAGAPATLEASAAVMEGWLGARYGIEGARFVNHSGLTDRARVSPAGMMRLLIAEAGRLPNLLRDRAPRGAERAPGLPEGARMLAKTGTLNFAAALAGYLDRPDGQRRAFAIFIADLDERARLGARVADNPPGALAWESRARALELALLRRWAGA